MAPPPTPSRPPAKPPTSPMASATKIPPTLGDEHPKGHAQEEEAEDKTQRSLRNPSHSHGAQVGASHAPDGQPEGQAPVDVVGEPVARDAGRSDEHDDGEGRPVGQALRELEQPGQQRHHDRAASDPRATAEETSGHAYENLPAP